MYFENCKKKKKTMKAWLRVSKAVLELPLYRLKKKKNVYVFMYVCVYFSTFIIKILIDAETVLGCKLASDNIEYKKFNIVFGFI